MIGKFCQHFASHISKMAWEQLFNDAIITTKLFSVWFSSKNFLNLEGTAGNLFEVRLDEH